MKINSITTSICKSKALKKGLEIANDNGSIFVAGTQLACSTLIRPLSILATPNTDKENKKLACSKSIASSIANYLLVLGLSLPIAHNVVKIDKNPKQYLKPETIENLTEKGKPLVESKSYQFATQMFKLAATTVAAVPRALITAALISPIIIGIHKLSKKSKNNKFVVTPQNSSINNIDKAQVNVNFKGGKLDIAKGMGKIIDKPFVQNISEKLKDSNFGMHVLATADALTTTTVCHQINKNEDINEDRKRTLNYNNTISCGLGITSGYLIDKITGKSTQKFIKKFSKVNKNDPKLNKYLAGIKVAKPALVFAGVYYTLIPIVSTYLADRIGKKSSNI